MNYQSFKEELVYALGKRISGECRIFIQQFEKNNGITRESITLYPEDRAAAPGVYLEPLYEAYQEGAAMDQIVDGFLKMLEEHERMDLEDMDFFKNFKNIEKRICYRIINYEKNRKLLEHIPHRILMDLAVVYYYYREETSDNISTVLIRNEHIEFWGISEEILSRAASENTCRILPAKMEGLFQLIEQIVEELPEEQITDEQGEDMMYVLTNSKKFFGAGCILYDGVMERIYEYFESNYYILPSSIHECILVPEMEGMDPTQLKSVVMDVNRHCVQPEEVLSDQVYYYDHEKGLQLHQ